MLFILYFILFFHLIGFLNIDEPLKFNNKIVNNKQTFLKTQELFLELILVILLKAIANKFIFNILNCSLFVTK